MGKEIKRVIDASGKKMVRKLAIVVFATIFMWIIFSFLNVSLKFTKIASDLMSSVAASIVSSWIVGELFELINRGILKKSYLLVVEIGRFRISVTLFIISLAVEYLLFW